MMMRAIALLVLAASGQVLGQSQRTLIFAHNDYVHKRPFHAAYEKRVDFIEADVFYKSGKLLVAHTAIEISDDRTLSSLYLQPIVDQIARNKGSIYSEPAKRLTLMIDLKSDGRKTLQALVSELESFPVIIKCETMTIAVSGDMPPPVEWVNYPAYVHFDGRPTITYSTEQLDRVTLISASFKSYSSWNGRNELPDDDRVKLKEVIERVHSQGKLIRFWAIPDNPTAWKELINLGVDVINTDNAEEAVRAIRR